MSFIKDIQGDALFWWEVKFKWPAPDGRAFKDESFQAQFRRMTIDDFAARTAEIAPADDEIEPAQEETRIAMMRDFIRDVWTGGIKHKDLSDPTDDDVETLKEAMLSQPVIATAAYVAYNEAIAGRRLNIKN